MIHSFAEKAAVLIKPQSVATNATATGSVDRIGYDWITVDVMLDSQASTTSKPATLNLSENDSGTSWTNFYVGGTDFTIPNSGSAATIVRFNIDGRKRKRNIRIALTSADAAQLASAEATLRRAKETPDTNAERGVSGFFVP